MILLEPKRQTATANLNPKFKNKLLLLLTYMKAEGYDPVLFETVRSKERQLYLYSIGRTRQKNRKPVTWTLDSYHLTGKAADIISKSKGWDNERFFIALKRIAKSVGLNTINKEGCHVQLGF